MKLTSGKKQNLDHSEIRLKGEKRVKMSKARHVLPRNLYTQYIKLLERPKLVLFNCAIESREVGFDRRCAIVYIQAYRAGQRLTRCMRWHRVL